MESHSRNPSQWAADRAETIAQLTPGIVHDFNNSLQNIVAALELVRKLIATGRGNEAERFIATAISASQRAAALNERLINLSSAEPAGPRRISMNELIGGLEDLLRRTLPSSIHLALELSPDLWDIHCDVEQAQIAVLNLVLDASRALPSGGTISITTCNSDSTAATSLQPEADVAPCERVCFVITRGNPSVTDFSQDDVMPPTTSSSASATPHLEIAARFARENAGDMRVHRSSTGSGSVVMYLPAI